MDDPQHFLSCSMLKRRAMTVRHDSVVRLLRDFFHHAGALVHIEPRIYETKRFRPDLDILLADTNIMIDVGIEPVCPLVHRLRLWRLLPRKRPRSWSTRSSRRS